MLSRLVSCVTAAVLVVLLGVSTAASREAPRQGVTFSRDVAPILYRHCVTCHQPGASAPFSLLTYNDARVRARLIAQTTERRVMPPWQPLPGGPAFTGERRLTDIDIQMLRQWVEAGAPEGRRADLPPPPRRVEGWQLGQPDLIVSMPDAFEVPAGGPDFFRNFVLPLSVPATRFVQAIEVQPGNPRVVHHARVMVDDTGASRRQDAAEPQAGFGGMDTPGARFPDGYFLGWAPGKVPKREATAWPLAPGTDLVVQAHLRPTGRTERVRTSVGLYFTDTPPAFTPAMLQMGARTLDIPANEPAYVVQDAYVLPVDVRVHRIAPHAHYLGKEIEVRASPPGQPVLTLLRITNWDFNWQDDYDYAEPVTLPAGTRIDVRFSYDNSAANPRNPNSPPQRVRFGPDARDEMCELLLQLVPVAEADMEVLQASIRRKTIEIQTLELEKRTRDRPDEVKAWSALGASYMEVGRFEDGARAFDTAVGLTPNDPVANYNAGQVAFARRDYARAQTYLERAIAQRPELVEAQTTLAATLAFGGHEARAVERLRAALAVRPGHVPAAVNLSRLLTRAGDSHGAVTVVERALVERPREPGLLDALAQANSAAGRQAPVTDLEGRPVVLPDPGAKATVVLFAESDCPISNRYAPEVRRLFDAFATKAVSFITVYPNPTDTAEVIRKHTVDYRLPPRAVRDPEHVLVARTGATIAPEVAVFDAEGRMAYRGRIDDRYASVGVERASPARRDLEDVLTTLAAGRPLAPRTTTAVGCYIADMAR